MLEILILRNLASLGDLITCSSQFSKNGEQKGPAWTNLTSALQ